MVRSEPTSLSSPRASANGSMGRMCSVVRSMSRRSAGICPVARVAAGVHHIAPVQAGIGELGEGVVGGQQVRICGHQVGLRDADCGLRAALRLGIVGHATDHLAAVMPACGDHLRMTYRDPGDVLDGDRLRVVGQYLRRCTADPPERGVQAGHQSAQRAVPDRDHHPETATRTATRRTARSDAPRCAAPRPSRTATTGPARESTGGTFGACPPSTRSLPCSPPVSSSVRCPGSPSSRACRGPHRRGSSLSTARPTP